MEDTEAWQFFSGIAWIPEDASPFRQIRRVPPATRIEFDRGGKKTTSRYMDYVSLFDPDSGVEVRPEAIAEEMTRSVINLASMSKSSVTAQLSGGKDSRVTAAAVLHAKVPCRISTIGTIKQEADTARKLLGLVNREIEHSIIRPEPRPPSESIAIRGSRAMKIWDGDMNSNSLNPSTNPYSHDPGLTFAGWGGEIAHGNYYPSEKMFRFVTDLERPTDRLAKAFASSPGVTPESASLIRLYLDRYHDWLWDAGLRGPSILDGFYLAERTRRWVAAGHLTSSPILYGVPSFTRKAMSLKPEVRFRGELQVDVLRHLIPQWADVPFFKSPITDRDAKEQDGLRLWQGVHLDEFFERLLTGLDDPLWNSEAVMELLYRVIRGDTDRRLESTFQRVLWRSAFVEHVHYLGRKLPVVESQLDLRHERVDSPEIRQKNGETAAAQLKRREEALGRRLARTQSAWSETRKTVDNIRDDLAASEWKLEKRTREAAHLQYRLDVSEWKLASLRQRRWWRIGVELGEVRRRPRRLLTLPIRLLRVIGTRSPRLPRPAPPSDFMAKSAVVDEAQS